MTVPIDGDVEDFLEQVSEVSILVEGLSKGTISPEYVDRKLGTGSGKAKQGSDALASAPAAAGTRPLGPTAAAPTVASAAVSHVDAETEAKKAEEEAERRERLMEKATALKHNYERKLKARKRFEEYTAEAQAKAGTDYTRWDMWCPSDEEDDLINSITPNSSAFKALEKDIDERHNRMVEQRQIAERLRVKGNEAFKTLQYSEALRCYQEGLASEKTNMALHSNAAMAALKLQCYVQAIEHCDKALNIADFLHNNLKCALCTKTYQRRATAYRALQQYSKAVQDLELAGANDPDSKEIQQQLARARAELEEYRKQKQVKKALKKQEKQQGAVGEVGAREGKEGKEAEAEGAGCEALDVGKLQRVEQITQLMQQYQRARQREQDLQCCPGSGSGSETISSSDPAPPADSTKRGPQLPARRGKAGAIKNGQAATEDTAAMPSSVAGCCEELVRLINGDDFASVYLRECGGLQAVAQAASAGIQAVSGGAASGAMGKAPQAQEQQAKAGAGAEQAAAKQATACVNLLNAASANDANLLLLPSLGVLPAAVQALGGRDGATAEAALRLLCTAATCEEVRKRLSLLLGTDAGLRSLFRLLGSAPDHTRVVALAVLGNCMVDGCTRQAMQKLLQPPMQQQQQQGEAAAASSSVGPCLVALLRSRSAAVQEKAFTLCGNMCGHEALRSALAMQKGLVEAAMAALLLLPAAAAGTDARQQQQGQPQTAAVQQAAAALLYNLSLDPEVQHVLLERAAKANGSHVDELLALLQRPACDLRLAARIAGIVARCFKHPQRLRQLPGSCHLDQLLSLLSRCSDDLASGSSAATTGTAETGGTNIAGSTNLPAAAGGADEDSPAAAAADAVVRCLTLLTQDEGPNGMASIAHLLKLGGVEALLCTIKQLQLRPADGTAASTTKKTRESILGNAALCLGHLARDAEALPVLQRLDVVQPLVGVAYEGKGSTSSKNAAIALARMAKHPQMLERLRELHGIEIIYQYVRP